MTNTTTDDALCKYCYTEIKAAGPCLNLRMANDCSERERTGSRPDVTATPYSELAHTRARQFIAKHGSIINSPRTALRDEVLALHIAELLDTNPEPTADSAGEPEERRCHPPARNDCGDYWKHDKWNIDRREKPEPCSSTETLQADTCPPRVTPAPTGKDGIGGEVASLPPVEPRPSAAESAWPQEWKHAVVAANGRKPMSEKPYRGAHEILDELARIGALTPPATAPGVEQSIMAELGALLAKFATVLPKDTDTMGKMFPIQLGMMNGNVCQRVYGTGMGPEDHERPVLRVRDFWRLAELLPQLHGLRERKVVTEEEIAVAIVEAEYGELRYSRPKSDAWQWKAAKAILKLVR